MQFILCGVSSHPSSPFMWSCLIETTCGGGSKQSESEKLRLGWLKIEQWSESRQYWCKWAVVAKVTRGFRMKCMIYEVGEAGCKRNHAIVLLLWPDAAPYKVSRLYLYLKCGINITNDSF